MKVCRNMSKSRPVLLRSFSSPPDTGAASCKGLAVYRVAELFLRAHIVWPSIILTMDGRRSMHLGAKWESVMTLTVVCGNAHRRRANLWGEVGSRGSWPDRWTGGAVRRSVIGPRCRSSIRVASDSARSMLIAVMRIAHCPQGVIMTINLRRAGGIRLSLLSRGLLRAVLQ